MTLTLVRLAEIEAAAAKAVVGYAKWYSQNDLTLSECCDSDDATYIALCDPATVAALCRIARAAVEWERMSASPPEWDDFEQAETDLSDALRDVGLLE